MTNRTSGHIVNILHVAGEYLSIRVVLVVGCPTIDGNLARFGQYFRHTDVVQHHLSRVTRLHNLRCDFALTTIDQQT